MLVLPAWSLCCLFVCLFNVVESVDPHKCQRPPHHHRRHNHRSAELGSQLWWGFTHGVSPSAIYGPHSEPVLPTISTHGVYLWYLFIAHPVAFTLY